MSLLIQAAQLNQPQVSPDSASYFMLTNFLTDDLVERDFFAFMSDDKIDSLVTLVLREVGEDFFDFDYCTDLGAMCDYKDEDGAIEFIKALSFKLV